MEEYRSVYKAVSHHSHYSDDRLACTFRHSITFRMTCCENKCLKDVILRLRHSSIQTTDQVYGHLRRR